ncbi:glycoside hydrolase family 2 TIM barrel-domain containing protein [Mucilaginibacter sp. PAMB04168]|uniref:glycoside hydrolase family 2 TIM barrel-domain containing protein n=1 Tax=Mucilaginibacter sp. PAMB04168 TaxID=3138567 RepID=UPI0031F717E7
MMKNFRKFSFSAIMCCGLFISAYAQPVTAPLPVKVVAGKQGFNLTRAGKPYFIKGAGGTNYSDRLASYGGNSLRTWDSRNGQDVLDKAQKLGLSVTMGLNVARERHGFNYDDTAAVHQQLERLRQEVRKYKNHPALLIWGIGNELNLQYKNPKVWDAVNDIAKMIHQEDPNHPATTMLAGVNKREVDYIKVRCPNLDLLSVQVYGGLAKVPQQMLDAGWQGAYMVTEWGPTGHWEGPQTPWKASVEETSSEKAAVYKSRYEASIKQDKHCVGSYVFLWGQKQERTPTWYGLFTEAGEENEVVDVMQYLWTGSWPKNRAPHISSFLLNGKPAADNIFLQPGKSYNAVAAVTDPNQDKLTTRWELLPESTDLKEGGDHESRPQPINGLLSSAVTNKAILKTPEKEGAYRLFVYVSDGHNKVATANIPFYVRAAAQ